ncbi:myozenin-2 [Latimeria chalumnae]|uniref:myozenin-2 n=1 Tax=Latimeria chalumnae TaxID=7897 RepID=UPI0003C18223|nr:PREDICTED: myozenin-3 [Latimeria chalumnae]|eukprot:XP_005988349.1 PREDICTED: myozenin-3 [Latimeria chalumnae]
MMPISYSDLTKERKQKALAIVKEIHGKEKLNLGKKISVPRDVMMEELSLLANKGSRMFQERQKRVERFTIENAAAERTMSVHSTAAASLPSPEGGKENYRTEIYIQQPGKGMPPSPVTPGVPRSPGTAGAPSHRGTTAGAPPVPLKKLPGAAELKRTNPNAIAPGYSGPLKEIPPEKFNNTAVPKSYQSPWQQALMEEQGAQLSVTEHLSELPKMTARAQYRCFNRVAVPFGGSVGSGRIFPLPGFEMSRAQTEPQVNWERISKRPNFNRAPRGWRVQMAPESAEL